MIVSYHPEYYLTSSPFITSFSPISFCFCNLIVLRPVAHYFNCFPSAETLGSVHENIDNLSTL